MQLGLGGGHSEREALASVFVRKRADLLSLIAVGVIAMVALYLRWDRLDYVEFGVDQAWVMNRAYEFVTTGELPLAGIRSSLGTSQGPVEVWLLALAVAISPDPVVASGYVGLLQTLAIIGAYFLASRYFGRVVGLSTAALFAVNPWALEYGRKVWTPDTMPVFTVLFFGALFTAVVDRRQIYVSLAIVWLVLLFLTHPSAALYVPLLLLVVLLFWRRLSLRALLLGGLLGLIVALPYLYHEYLNSFRSLTGYLNVSAQETRPPDLEAFSRIVKTASAADYPMFLGTTFRGAWGFPDLSLQNALATLLLFLGLVACIWRLVRARQLRREGGGPWEAHALLLLWFLVPVLITARQMGAVQMHYLVALFPVQYILVAVGLDQAGRTVAWALSRYRLPGLLVSRGVVLAFVLWLALSQIGYFQHYLRLVQENGPIGPYGIPLVYSKQAVATLRDLRAELADPLIYTYAYIQSRPLDYLALPDLRPRRVDPPLNIVFPKDNRAGAVFLLASDDASLLDRHFYLVADDGPMIPRLRELGFVELPERAVRGPGAYNYFRFFWLPPGRGDDIVSSFTRPAQPLALANGMRLLGYSLPARQGQDRKLRLSLLWEFPNPPIRTTSREYNLFVHAVDRDGREVASKDQELFQYASWRADEYVISFHELVLPEGFGPSLLWFDIGAYSRFDQEEVAWLGPAGEKAPPAKVGPSVVPPPTASPAPQSHTSAALGQALDLVGYDLRSEHLAPASTLDLTLHWRPNTSLEGDYVVSVQLIDGSGKLVAQHDSPPVNGQYPTSYWQTGDTVLDPHTVEIPGDCPPGVYSVTVVVYSADDHERLPVVLADGTHEGTALPLADVQIRADQ